MALAAGRGRRHGALAAVLKPLCGKVPQWTLAFNAATLSALLYTRPFAGRRSPRRSTEPQLLNAVLDTPFVGISQILSSTMS